MNDTLLDDEIPEKFKNKETGEVNLNAMVKSYKELESKMSKSPALPETAEEYCVDCEHGLFQDDKELNQKMFEKGFSQDQVQFVYDIAAEKLVPLAVEIAGNFQADREIEKLVEHFGGVEKWKEISKQLLIYGQKNLSNNVLDTLTSSYDGVIALYNMMKGNEPMISSGEGNLVGGSEREVQSMMRDPKYWRDKDPSFIAEVTQKFESLYGNK